MLEYLNRFLNALHTLKNPLTIIISTIAIWQLVAGSLMGGQDRRETAVRFILMLALAGLMHWSTELINWIGAIFR